MSVSPQELLDNSRFVQVSQTTECGFRAVASRAYYAAYHAALAFHEGLPSGGLVIKARGLHERLVEQLKNPSFTSTDPRFSQSRRIGIMLADAHRNRVLADYRLSDPFDASVVADVMDKADKIFAIAFPAPPTPAPATAPAPRPTP